MASIKFVPPRVPLVDLRTGTITREWFLLFQQLFTDNTEGPGTVPVSPDDVSPFQIVQLDTRPDALAFEIVDQPPQSISPMLDQLQLMTAIQGMAQDFGSRMDQLELLLADFPAPRQSPPNLAAGTYTPTTGNLANVTSVSITGQAQFMRVGNVVTVSGLSNVRPTATGALTAFNISLPIPSNLGAVEDCAGIAASGGLQQSGFIIGDAPNDQARVIFFSTTNTAQDLAFQFTYEVI